MGGMEMDIAQEVATSQVVWAILCIALAFVVIREMRKDNAKKEDKLTKLYDLQQAELKESFARYRKESKDREDKLMDHLKRSNESQEQTSLTLQSINGTLISLEGRIDRIEKMSIQKEVK